MADTTYTDQEAIRVLGVNIQAITEDIQTNTENIQAETDKIDSLATDGLLGVEDSTAYRIHEIGNHFHNHEKWLGVAAVAVGETHVADRVGGATAAFQLVAGNNTFGNWVQILGSTDTPVETGQVKFDLHRILITDTNSTRPFIIHLVEGESADIAAKIVAEDFTEIMYKSATNNNDSGIAEIIDKRCDAGIKHWARCADIGGNGTNINFYFGLHEYEG